MLKNISQETKISTSKIGNGQSKGQAGMSSIGQSGSHISGGRGATYRAVGEPYRVGWVKMEEGAT